MKALDLTFTLSMCKVPELLSANKSPEWSIGCMHAEDFRGCVG
jgi:hypothetical protein